ncbi:hypothetical protein C1N90_27255 (plasmid) [Priestia aryabhattai]
MWNKVDIKYKLKGDKDLKNRTLLNVIGIFIILISSVLFINMLHSSGASLVLIVLIIVVGLLFFKFNLL